MPRLLVARLGGCREARQGPQVRDRMTPPLPSLAAGRFSGWNLAMQVLSTNPLEEFTQHVLSGSERPDQETAVLDREINGGPFLHPSLRRKRPRNPQAEAVRARSCGRALE